MTYEEFCAEIGRHEAAGMQPGGDEMKEVFRWAAREQFDHLWTYLTVKSVPVEPPASNKVAQAL